MCEGDGRCVRVIWDGRVMGGEGNGVCEGDGRCVRVIEEV